MAGEQELDAPPPARLSLFRLVVDKARITPEVENYAYRGSGTDQDPYVVTWIPNDPGDPFTWSPTLRWTMAVLVSVQCLAIAFSSSAWSGTVKEIAADLTHSEELVLAGISLFVLGFAVGPLLWGPLSEIFGRQIVFFVTFGLCTAFNAGAIGANDIGTLLVMRFFAGAFGSSPLANGGGVIADIFPPAHRGPAMNLFGVSPSLAPSFGPIAGGFLGETSGWRWVMALMTFFTGILWILGSLLVPETYAPVLLRERAKVLSKKTGKVYKTKVDITNGPIRIKEVAKIVLIRPWILLVMEPIVLLLSMYIAIIYGTLYLLFGAYPIVFQQTRGWSEGIGSLPFLGVATGTLLGVSFGIYANKWYLSAAAKNGGFAPPETRLRITMIGAPAIPIGMFWFAWSNSPKVHWIVPVLAGVPFGFGLNIAFLTIITYLIDSYTIYAASVMAANGVLRSSFGAAFPLFVTQMYKHLGIHWASSVPAFLSLACVPFPFIFYRYGAAIRAKCVWAARSDAAMKELRAQKVEETGNGNERDEEKAGNHENEEGAVWNAGMEKEVERDALGEDIDGLRYSRDEKESGISSSSGFPSAENHGGTVAVGHNEKTGVKDETRIQDGLEEPLSAELGPEKL